MADRAVVQKILHQLGLSFDQLVGKLVELDAQQMAQGAFVPLCLQQPYGSASQKQLQSSEQEFSILLFGDPTEFDATIPNAQLEQIFTTFQQAGNDWDRLYKMLHQAYSQQRNKQANRALRVLERLQSHLKNGEIIIEPSLSNQLSDFCNQADLENLSQKLKSLSPALGLSFLTHDLQCLTAIVININNINDQACQSEATSYLNTLSTYLQNLPN